MISGLRSFPVEIQALLRRKAVCFSFVRLSSFTGSFAMGQKAQSHSFRTPDLAPKAAQCCPSRAVITEIISFLGADCFWKLLRTGRAAPPRDEPEAFPSSQTPPSLVATLPGIWLRWQSWSSSKELEKKSGKKSWVLLLKTDQSGLPWLSRPPSKTTSHGPSGAHSSSSFILQEKHPITS